MQLNYRYGGKKASYSLWIHSCTGGQYRFLSYSYISFSLNFFFVRHICRLKVILHTKLCVSKCFSKKAKHEAFFCVCMPIQPYRCVTATPEKKEKKSIDRTYTYWYTFKERREYCAETMHDKLKCMTNVGLLTREKRNVNKQKICTEYV